MAAPKGNKFTLLRETRPGHTPEDITDIAESLIDWAITSDEIFFECFIYKKYKKSKNWLVELSERHPEIKQAMDTVKTIIAGKVANRGFNGTCNAVFGEKLLPMYSKEYKELMQWKASLDKKDDTMQTLSDIKKMVATGQIIDELKQKEDK